MMTLTRSSLQAVQAFVAALGLNWSIVSAIDPSSHVPGTVVYSNLTQFYFGNNYQSSSADQITAHLVCGLDELPMERILLS